MDASVETLNFPLLEVENLSKRFGDSAALTSISFSVREKEIAGVIGPESSSTSKLYVEHDLSSAVSGKIGVWSKSDSVVYFNDYPELKNARNCRRGSG
jgi:ABC-type uncharacterized transport system ATPase subunit